MSTTAKKPKWKRKHLIGIKDLKAWEIEHLLETAESFKEILSRPIKKVPALRGKTIAIFFVEASTRTRSSFELACKALSADTLNISPSVSSVKKGESILDTVMNLEALKADAIIVRHKCAGVPTLLSNKMKGSVINAGDGFNEHPTQALLDLLTIKETKGRIKGLNVVIVGDILHSRVARSNIWALTTLGAKVTLVCPPNMLPDQIDTLPGVSYTYKFEQALKNADVIMMLRIQNERHEAPLLPTLREYSRLFGLDSEMLSKAPKDAIVMHPGPINRGVEITSEVADGPRSVILNQVTNGLAVRMAVLFLCLQAGLEEAPTSEGKGE